MTKFMKSAHHSLLGRPICLAVRPRQRSASSNTSAAPGTCAAFSTASVRLSGMFSEGTVLTKRSPDLLLAACADQPDQAPECRSSEN